MNKNSSKKIITKFAEIDGLKEYKMFARYLEEAKRVIDELQVRAYAERQPALEICAFQKDLSPMFICMIELANNLISKNLSNAKRLVEGRCRNKWMKYADFIPYLDEDDIPFEVK